MTEMPAPATTRESGNTASNHGYYIYGIVPEDVELDPGTVGVGNPQAQVQLIRQDGVAALVSEVDLSQPLGRPADLLAHQQLLDAAAAEIPVLPFRFGAVMTDSAAVADDLLAPHNDEFATTLNDLEGCAQYVVRGRYAEQAILAEVLAEDQEAEALRARIHAAAHSEATRNLRIRLGEIINQAIAAKREADTRKVSDVVAAFAVTTSVREATHERDAANVAVLAQTSRQADLERAVDQLGREWAERVTLRLLGPMAPYDFVTATAAGG